MTIHLFSTEGVVDTIEQLIVAKKEDNPETVAEVKHRLRKAIEDCLAELITKQLENRL